MPKFEDLRQDYATRWEAMQIRPEWAARARQQAERILAAKRHYEPVSGATGVPWHVIGIIHTMECGGSFRGHLHNGDPLTARTVQVPANRPPTGKPPFTWEASAIDAIRYDGLDKVKDWGPEQLAWCLEKFNGFGYRSKGVPSAYLWSGSNQYTRGKYVRDGKDGWSPTAISQQVGGMVLLKTLLELDPELSEGSDDLTQAATEFPKAEKVADAAEPVALPSPKEMAAVSRKFWLLERVKTWLFGGGIATLIGGKAANDASVSDPMGLTQIIFTFVKDHGLYIAITTLLIGYILFEVLQHLMRKDKAEGRYTPSGETAQ